MGRKSSSKRDQPPPPAEPAKGGGALMYSAVVVLVAGVAGFALWGSRDPGAAAPAKVAETADASNPSVPPGAATAANEAEAAAQAMAAFGPHKQAKLPPIPFQGFAPPRPVSVVTAAFEFAAEHPEITSYVPCFCGCERMGHRGNHDCFVRSRAANGDVVEWEEHGLECAVCIDVATRSRQMYASGASVRDIRTAIEKEFVPSSPVMTPTPKPPAHDH